MSGRMTPNRRSQSNRFRTASGLSGRRLTGRSGAMLLAVATLASVALGSCNSNTATVSLLSWNVQNLFDDVDDGSEYREFTRDGGWTRERYVRRLERIDEAVRLAGQNGPVASHGPDLIVLQEVEHAGIGKTLAHDFVRSHRYVIGDPRRNTTTAVLVLSRHQPRAVRFHDAVRVAVVPGSSEPEVTWRGRALVEVELAINGVSLSVLGAHWKSQSGGETRTESYRRQEGRLARGILARRAPEAILVGDLNEDLDEYGQHRGAYQTALMHSEHPGSTLSFVYADEQPGAPGDDGEMRADVASGWARGTRPWTYAYMGRWERLDHAFLALPSDLSISLEPLVADLLIRDGIPDRFDPRTGHGFSDHLPIVVTLTRRPAQ